MTSGIKIVLSTGLFLLLTQLAQAEIYKWVDEHGQTHYGEKPPAYNQAKKIQLRSQPGHSPSASSKQNTTIEKPADTATRLEKQKKLIRALSEDRKQKKEQREKLQRMEKQRIRNCAIAKDDLRRYENSSAVYKVDDKGNRITLPSSERDKSILRARAEAKKWCTK